MRHQHSFTTASATSIAGGVRRGAGNRKAGKVLNPVCRKIEGQQDGPVTGICGDGGPVARATVHSQTGSWDIEVMGDKGLFCGGLRAGEARPSSELSD